MSDFNTLVHGVQGGDELVFESGSTLTVKAGATLSVAGSDVTNAVAGATDWIAIGT